MTRSDKSRLDGRDLLEGACWRIQTARILVEWQETGAASFSGHGNKAGLGVRVFFWVRWVQFVSKVF